jgi:hypothetical protein
MGPSIHKKNNFIMLNPLRPPKIFDFEAPSLIRVAAAATAMTGRQARL